ncbi:mycofactocin biosynthesis peptidyl-dipeptidase MftE [Streptomyces sp. NPDC056112]|uniref:mycofactocin biosynthesis peptidyl-dipeptidase MftE n=1 Tax=Streptomyces sp. NPDC056112 TaxID=3345715 RepID=UPI0035DE9CF1
MSGEHQGFPGTLSIGQEAVELLLVELVRSAALTFRQVISVSAHGGNAQPVTRAVRVRSEGRNVLAWAPRWDGDAHVGRTETSAMRALTPDQVRLDAARPGNPTRILDRLPQLRESGLSLVTPNGALGDPAGAHAEEGETLLQRATADLTEMVNSQRIART